MSLVRFSHEGDLCACGDTVARLNLYRCAHIIHIVSILDDATTLTIVGDRVALCGELLVVSNDVYIVCDNVLNEILVSHVTALAIDLIVVNLIAIL